MIGETDSELACDHCDCIRENFLSTKFVSQNRKSGVIYRQQTANLGDSMLAYNFHILWGNICPCNCSPWRSKLVEFLHEIFKIT